ncbi:MAG: winged helix-turn-helix domain-containing protein [Phycisphaerales bacterium]|nr:MAG: winged helix-turn-helix domain-containing protein [Phycisphaerales bacterium]
MRPPAQIKDWLGIDEMFRWLQEAPSEAAHKRRMAIWLTHTGKLHARQVAEILGISTQAVWLWIRQYNQAGPAGLVRTGRGGRRRSFMSREQEVELLAPLIQKARAGQAPKPNAIRQIIEQQLGHSVSMSYIYRLLRRHGWADVLARSHAPKRSPNANDTFADLTRPWRRED